VFSRRCIHQRTALNLYPAGSNTTGILPRLAVKGRGVDLDDYRDAELASRTAGEATRHDIERMRPQRASN